MSIYINQQPATKSQPVFTKAPLHHKIRSFQDNRSATLHQTDLIKSIQRVPAHTATNKDGSVTYAGTAVVTTPLILKEPAVSVTGSVNVYQEELPQQNNRLKAIATMADKAAEIGNRVFNYDNIPAPENKGKYATVAGTPGEMQIEPFIFRIKTTHKNQSPQEPWRADRIISQDHNANRPLELDYQMAQPFTGYVIRVKDGELEGGMTAGVAPIPSGAIPVLSGKVVADETKKYSDLETTLGLNEAKLKELYLKIGKDGMCIIFGILGWAISDNSVGTMLYLLLTSILTGKLSLDIRNLSHIAREIRDNKRSLSEIQQMLEDLEKGDGTAVSGKYGNRHEVTGASTISSLITTDNYYEDKSKLPRAWDATTKLAGEGARFLCVRNNIDKIQDDSIIYTTGTNTAKGLSITNPGMTFPNLWISWSGLFEKKYNIPDTKVANVLKTSHSPKIIATAPSTKDIEVK